MKYIAFCFPNVPEQITVGMKIYGTADQVEIQGTITKVCEDGRTFIARIPGFQYNRWFEVSSCPEDSILVNFFRNDSGVAMHLLWEDVAGKE